MDESPLFRGPRSRLKPLSDDEIRAAVSAATPPILTPAQLAALLGLSRKTIYEWIARGRLDGAFRKRGKHNLIWRDRALKVLFNGPEWETDEPD
jgi:excisionase family DNA binding protein